MVHKGMEELAKYPGLYRRGNIWYVRKRVPVDVREYFNAEHVKRSTKTEHQKKAIKLYHNIMQEFEGEFEAERLAHKPEPSDKIKLDSLSEADILSLACAWHRQYRADYEARELKSISRSYALEEISDAVISLQIDQDTYADALKTNDFTCIYSTASRWLNKHRYMYSRQGKNYALFCHYVLKALCSDIHHRLSTLEQGVSSYEPPAIFNGQHAHAKTSHFDLVDMSERYLAQAEKEHVGLKNKERERSIIRLLNSYAEKPLSVGEITRSFLEEYRNQLRLYPNNAHSKYKGMAFRDVITAAQQGGEYNALSVKSVNTHMSTIKAVLAYAVLNDYIPKNPAKKLLLKDTTPEKTKRMPWSVGALEAIFTTPLCRIQDQERFSKSKYDEAVYWFQLISLWTGMIVSEIAQLRHEDLACEDGIYYFDIVSRPEIGAKTKTPFRVRRVPIHQELIKCGVLTLVDKPSKDGWLFSGLTQGSINGRGAKVGERFRALCKKYSIHEDKCSFHSFRHNFRDALRDAEISHGIALALGGWTDGQKNLVADGYGSGYTIKKLNENLQRIHYDGVSLSHLYVD